MEIVLIKFIQTLLLPPGLMLALMLIGYLLARRFLVFGRLMVFTGFVLLWVASLPLVAETAIGLLERESPALTVADLHPPRAQAIVVLGGGRRVQAPEYGRRDVLSADPLERVRYAAWLHRRTRLPILVTGGTVFSEERLPEATLMRETLQREFDVPVRWLEPASRNSRENAVFSRRLLAPARIDRIYLVTHAWHMPRARRAFEQAGFTVVPAPTGFHTFSERPLPLRLLPSADALFISARFMHEVIGMAWYAIRY